MFWKIKKNNTKGGSYKRNHCDITYIFGHMTGNNAIYHSWNEKYLQVIVNGDGVFQKPKQCKQFTQKIWL